jgi:hypothetical protein
MFAWQSGGGLANSLRDNPNGTRPVAGGEFELLSAGVESRV